MNYESIDQIYEANDRFQGDLKAAVEGLSDEQLSKIADGGNWSPAHLLEHVAMVDEGISRICAKLLGKAEAAGASAAGIGVSESFIQKGAEFVGIKVQAPEMVEPTGMRSVAESIEKMEESRERFEALRQRFTSFDGNNFKFPHPYFGELSALEWLILAGEHKRRHTGQLRAMLEEI
jgi:uncharacterized damage-inducible protein DinB